jgi:hypothetical protein
LEFAFTPEAGIRPGDVAFPEAGDVRLDSRHQGFDSDSNGTRSPSLSLFSIPIEVATTPTSTLSCGVNSRMKSVTVDASGIPEAVSPNPLL